MIDLDLDPRVLFLAFLEVARPSVVPAALVVVYGVRYGIGLGGLGIVVGLGAGLAGAVISILAGVYAVDLISLSADIGLIGLRIVALLASSGAALVLVLLSSIPTDIGPYRRLRQTIFLE